MLTKIFLELSRLNSTVRFEITSPRNLGSIPNDEYKKYLRIVRSLYKKSHEFDYVIQQKMWYMSRAKPVQQRVNVRTTQVLFSSFVYLFD